MKVPKIFNNEVVHYALIFLAVLNVVGYVAAKAYECLVLFGVGYYAANTYLKNVGLSVLAALFLSNFVFGCGRVTESFTENMKGAREHMKDSKKSADLAAFSLVEKMRKKQEKFSNKEGFFGRRTIEGFKESADKDDEAAEAIAESTDAGVKAIAALAEAGKAEEKAKKTEEEEESE